MRALCVIFLPLLGVSSTFAQDQPPSGGRFLGPLVQSTPPSSPKLLFPFRSQQPPDLGKTPVPSVGLSPPRCAVPLLEMKKPGASDAIVLSMAPRATADRIAVQPPVPACPPKGSNLGSSQ